MTQTLTLPQGRIPLGWVMVGGQKLPVEIDNEWLRAFATLAVRTGGVTGTNDQGADVFASAQQQSDGGQQTAFPDIQSPAEAASASLFPLLFDVVQATTPEAALPDIAQPATVDAILPDVMQSSPTSGYSGGITTALLVGKTITVSNGLITSFA